MSAHQISPEMQSSILRIQKVFAEHFPQSYEEWEAGFITESRPEHEIEIWLDAAATYETFSRAGSSSERRKDVYKVVGACLTGMEEYAIYLITNKLNLSSLSRAEARKIIDYFYELRELRRANEFDTPVTDAFRSQEGSGLN